MAEQADSPRRDEAVRATVQELLDESRRLREQAQALTDKARKLLEKSTDRDEPGGR